MLVTWAAGCAVLCGFLLALVETGWRPLLHLDVAVDRNLHVVAVHHRVWTGVMLVVSAVLAPVVLRGFPGLVVLRLWWAGERVAAVRAAACGLVQVVLEPTVGRPRPALPQPVVTATGWSFPSGHTMTAARLLPLFAPMAWPRVHRPCPTPP
ncbi:phosphatase PAP2 family protein [Streptacidiphilus melanogenes]|uniref:phosphatase PAP2 family protein n=1 Tax=Streptacidiphilus melanogenes TaxID=411235 RepID=UPI00126A08FB|nr:phosphatase PAP2 family protein [Streptacidiphilus melanogenes]